MQLKLDEIIRSLPDANSALLNMEELDEKDLEVIRGEDDVHRTESTEQKGPLFL